MTSIAWEDEHRPHCQTFKAVVKIDGQDYCWGFDINPRLKDQYERMEQALTEISKLSGQCLLGASDAGMAEARACVRGIERGLYQVASGEAFNQAADIALSVLAEGETR